MNAHHPNAVCHNCGHPNHTPLYRACAACRAGWRTQKPSRRQINKERLEKISGAMRAAAQNNEVPGAKVRHWALELATIMEAL